MTEVPVDPVGGDQNLSAMSRSKRASESAERLKLQKKA